MKQGTLVYDFESDRYDIRFDLEDYHGGLHCGDTFEVFANGEWKHTRIENYKDWYLVGIRVDEIAGLMVRI